MRILLCLAAYHRTFTAQRNTILTAISAAQPSTIYHTTPTTRYPSRDYASLEAKPQRFSLPFRRPPPESELDHPIWGLELLLLSALSHFVHQNYVTEAQSTLSHLADTDFYHVYRMAFMPLSYSESRKNWN